MTSLRSPGALVGAFVGTFPGLSSLPLPSVFLELGQVVCRLYRGICRLPKLGMTSVPVVDLILLQGHLSFFDKVSMTGSWKMNQ